MQQNRLQKLESIFKIIAVFIAAGWTYYVFRYQYITVPSEEPLACDIKTEIKKIGIYKNMTYLKLTFHIKNESKIIVNFPATFFNIDDIKF